MIAIPLSQGKVALINDCDAHLAAHRWYAARRGKIWYAVRHKTRTTLVYLHREVIQPSPGTEVDHVNRDGLDCRRENLRPATASENRRNRERKTSNRSGFKGVHWNPSNKGWVACVKVHRKAHYLGTFQDPVEAARAYDSKARELHGVFARLNFPGAA
jgi:hypothetical protein